jgi:hypothetical protein
VVRVVLEPKRVLSPPYCLRRPVRVAGVLVAGVLMLRLWVLLDQLRALVCLMLRVKLWLVAVVVGETV